LGHGRPWRLVEPTTAGLVDRLDQPEGVEELASFVLLVGHGSDSKDPEPL
jgi:hypothetical protein